MAEKFEYKIIKGNEGNLKKFERKLNEAGEEGWELITITYANLSDNVKAYLKRRK